MQVSFRYHCQLYSEWRRTNQKVRLLIPEAKDSNSSQHSLLSTKLMKKSANESIVWDQTETISDNGVFYVRGLTVYASTPPAGLYRSTCGLFLLLFYFFLFFWRKKHFFAPSVLNLHQFFLNLSSCGCRNEHIWMQSVCPDAGCWPDLCKDVDMCGDVNMGNSLSTMDEEETTKLTRLVDLRNVLMIVLLGSNNLLMVHR